MTKVPTVIVSGLPRSGTSMMMQMLVAGGIEAFSDNLRVPDEDNPRGYLEHEGVKGLGSNPTLLLQSEGRCVKVIHRLLRYLPAGPSYCIVFVHRDIDEVLASQQAMLERMGRSGAGLDHDRLRSLFEGEIRGVVQMLEARSDVRLLEVTHADVITNPSAVAESVASFIEACPTWNHSLDRDAMTDAVDPALHRQRTEH
jgi:hypothetical protein